MAVPFPALPLTNNTVKPRKIYNDQTVCAMVSLKITFGKEVNHSVLPLNKNGAPRTRSGETLGSTFSLRQVMLGLRPRLECLL